MKEDVFMVYYTETDCFWLDQICRFWCAWIIIFRVSQYFHLVLTCQRPKEKLVNSKHPSQYK